MKENFLSCLVFILFIATVPATLQGAPLDDCIRCHVDEVVVPDCTNKAWLIHLNKGYVDLATFELAETSSLGALCSDKYSSANNTGFLKDKSRKLKRELRCKDGLDNDRDKLIDCADPDCDRHPVCQACVCYDVWDPVCGVDGVTYGNDCEAACAGVEIAYHGECGTPSICGGIAGFLCPPGYDCDMEDPKCSTVDLAGICVPDPDDCPRIWDPVCGCKGVTYANDCMRLKAGDVLASPGKCPCVCPQIYDPVCGVDGVTYGNKCKAACAGVEIAYHGECQTPSICGGITGIPCEKGYICDMKDPKCNTSDLAGSCVPMPDACPRIWDPVCSCDGMTYANDCERLRAGAVLASPGACPCVCPEIYAPVCGTDGITYDNECFAKCAGVPVAYKGECGKMCGGIAGFQCPDGMVCNYVDPTCSIIDLAGTCVPKADACIMLYNPVCGCDGVTYSNDCFRIMAGATLAHKGECKSCDDGSLLMCKMMVPNCPKGTVVAVQKNCYVCADPVTCNPVPF